jgi:ABC-type phosphate transport system substrate-binding protein
MGVPILRSGLVLLVPILAGATLVIPSTAGASTTPVVAVGASETQSLIGTLFPTSVDSIAAGATRGAASPLGCAGGITYSAADPAPDSSATGALALASEEQAASSRQGCLGIDRSSAPPGGSGPGLADDANLQYFAFALDAVAPLVGSDSGATAAKPLDLTLAQIKAVYGCTVTRWNQLGATSTAPIVRYWPQAGSAESSVYKAILGFDPTTLTTTDHCHNNLDGSYLVTENAEDQIVADGNRATAFALYSPGAFATQWDHPSQYGTAKTNTVAGEPNTKGNWSPKLTLASVQDLAGSAFHPFVDFTAGKGRGSEAVDTTTVAETNEWYSHLGSTTIVPGVFYLYNVVDAALPTYPVALGLVGFDNTTGATPSGLCAGHDASAITAAGFVPLGTSGGPTGSDIVGSTCRVFAGSTNP